MAGRWVLDGWVRAFFFLFRWGKALTGLSALAAEMVSFWICISVPFFDLRSAGAAVGFPSREPTPPPPPPPEEDCCEDAPEPEAGAADGSEVMRSISVVPEESCPEAMAAGEAVRGSRASVRSPATCASRGAFRVGGAGETMDESLGGRLDPTAKLESVAGQGLRVGPRHSFRVRGQDTFVFVYLGSTISIFF